MYSMPYRKRTSLALQNAQLRVAALETIDPELDLGSGISVSAFNAKIEETRQTIEAHNKALSAVDQTRSTIVDLERSLTDLSTRLLSGVATVYGKSSSQYKMTYGPKRVRRTRSAEATDSPENTPAMA
jgi:methylthioribose-1-phosphate isomerase